MFLSNNFMMLCMRLSLCKWWCIGFDKGFKMCYRSTIVHVSSTSPFSNIDYRHYLLKKNIALDHRNHFPQWWAACQHATAVKISCLARTMMHPSEDQRLNLLWGLSIATDTVIFITMGHSCFGSRYSRIGNSSQSRPMCRTRIIHESSATKKFWWVKWTIN